MIIIYRYNTIAQVSSCKGIANGGEWKDPRHRLSYSYEQAFKLNLKH